MKNTYKINEIAKLYNLSADTLRYYEEKGILSPKRDTNHYRLYSMQDISTLNIIRSMRELDVPIEIIKKYLQNLSIETTLSFLESNEKLILQKIRQLENMLQDIQKRKNNVEIFRKHTPNNPEIKYIKDRPSLQLGKDIIMENEIDFVLKKLETQHENSIRIIGTQQIGATFDENSLAKGIYTHYSHVFFISDTFYTYDTIIPKGEYACLFYKGDYTQVGRYIQKLFSFVAQQGYRTDGAPMELYHIDNHDTKLAEEYITEIQVKVVP